MAKCGVCGKELYQSSYAGITTRGKHSFEICKSCSRKQKYSKTRVTGMNITDHKTGQTAIAFWSDGHLYVVPKKKLKEVL